jgi:hypothetical protein
MLNELMAQGSMIRTQVSSVDLVGVTCHHSLAYTALSTARLQAATNVNERSSRSHSIFTIVLQQRDSADSKRNTYAMVRCLSRVASLGAGRQAVTQPVVTSLLLHCDAGV